MQTLVLQPLPGPSTVTSASDRKMSKEIAKKKKRRRRKRPAMPADVLFLKPGRLCFDREVAPCFISPGGGKPNIDASPGSRSMGGCLHCGCSTTALKPRNQRKGTQRQRLITGHCPRLTIICWRAAPEVWGSSRRPPPRRPRPFPLTHCTRTKIPALAPGGAARPQELAQGDSP